MKHDIQIIFTDIDCTILNHGHDDHVFDSLSIEALKKAQQKGIKVFLCTARPYHSVNGCGVLDLITPDGIVCTNGAVVFVNDKLIHNHTFPNETIEQIIKVAHKHHITVELSNERDRWLTKKGNKYVDYYFAVFHEIYPKIRPYKGENISAALLMCPKKFDDILYKEMPKGISGVRFTDYGVDLHLDPIYKSEGVIAALEYLKISKDNALAIGDDYGDIPMFEAVKYSIAMDNGREETKAKATYIAPHIDESGVAKMLTDLLDL